MNPSYENIFLIGPGMKEVSHHLTKKSKSMNQFGMHVLIALPNQLTFFGKKRVSKSNDLFLCTCKAPDNSTTQN